MVETQHHEMIRRAKSGDRDAMADLLTSQQDRVFAVCLRMLGHRNDAEDLTQDVLTSIITHLDQFDGRSALSTWVYRITVNACLSHLRQRQRSRDVLTAHSEPGTGRDGSSMDGAVDPIRMRSLSQPQQDMEPAAVSNVEESERREQLLTAINMIDVSIRTLLILRDFHGLDYGQISEVMSIPVGTVKSRLFRARMALRRQLEQFSGDDEDVASDSDSQGQPLPGRSDESSGHEPRGTANSPTSHS
ncbi:MAG: RNA polymerase sigma factor [Planctomycetes bacterium]|nr:RNA polymerase sigma factor [Planctomycetota bacterium]